MGKVAKKRATVRRTTSEKDAGNRFSSVRAFPPLSERLEQAICLHVVHKMGL